MRMIINISFIIFFIYNANIIYADTNSYSIDSKDSSVQFLATGTPGFLRIHGKGANPVGGASFDTQTNLLSAELVVDLKEFTTEMSLRDRHMKEKYLEVNAYPQAKLNIDKQHLSFTKDPKVEVEVPARLTLHGVTKDVRIKAIIDRSLTNVVVDSTFSILLSDFNINIPSFAGVTVAKEVEIQVHLKAKRV